MPPQILKKPVYFSLPPLSLISKRSQRRTRSWLVECVCFLAEGVCVYLRGLRLEAYCRWTELKHCLSAGELGAGFLVNSYGFSKTCTGTGVSKVLVFKGLSHTRWRTDQARCPQVQLRSRGRRFLSDAEEDAFPRQALQETLVPAGSIWHSSGALAGLQRTGLSEQTGFASLGGPAQADYGRGLGDLPQVTRYRERQSTGPGSVLWVIAS